MTTTDRRATTVATLALTAALTSGPLLAAGTAHADDTAPTRSKAAVEHDERLAAGSASTGQLTKAQIEHREAADRSATTGTTGTTTSTDGGTGEAATTGGDAAAWQLAAAAALGALVTGAAFVGARQVAAHRPAGHAVTS